MENKELKKCLAFIKAEAVNTPKGISTRTKVIIPEELVNTIKEEINKHDGSFAINAEQFNLYFGWSMHKSRGNNLQKALNSQYPLGNNNIWKVGLIAKQTLYKFEIKEKIEE